MNKMLNKLGITLSYIILSCLLFFSLSVKANDVFLDNVIISLLKKEISDDKVIIEIQYSSRILAENISAKQSKIKNILLEKLDQNYKNFQVQIEYNDNKAEILSGKYKLFKEIPIAAKYIKFGDIIQSSDLKMHKIEVEKITSLIVSTHEEIIGMQAKKIIPTGNFIKHNDLLNPPVIKNSDPVNIVFSAGEINLKTSGIAQGSGAVGDMIKVKNISSGVVVLGQIINKNTVQVGGE